MIRIITFALCAVTLCSCTFARMEPKKYTCCNKEMKVVSVNYGSSWGPLYAYKADGIYACREVYKPKTDRKNSSISFPLYGQQEVAPTPDQWRVFWEKLERLKISRWRSTYRAKDIGVTVYDGLQWSMLYQTLKTSRETEGENAYPSKSDPDRVTLDQTAFDRLLAAYASLFPTSMHDFEQEHQ